MKIFENENSLWLWAVSLSFSLSLVWIFEPTSVSTLILEITTIILVSLFCGFTLASERAKTMKSRTFGAVCFAGTNLFLVSCIAFIGCFSPPRPHLTELSKEQRRQLAIESRAAVAQKIQARSSEADSSMIDLTTFYNRLLPVANGQSSRLRSLQPGIHNWNGSRFDVRGIVSLRNSAEGKIEGIPVEQKCEGIDFLHGIDPNVERKPVSSFVVHYASGQTAVISDLLGFDVIPSQSSSNSFPDAITWEKFTDTNGIVHPTFVFYLKKWKNPLPNEPIQTIDFVSDDMHSGAFLIAITLQKKLATKP